MCIRVPQRIVYGKNTFVENLAGYKSENNYVKLLK